MTQRNGQGPRGKGPRTGRGLGGCGSGASKQAATQADPATTDSRVRTQDGDQPSVRWQGRGQRLQRRQRACEESNTEQGRGRGRGKGRGRGRGGNERGRGQGR